MRATRHIQQRMENLTLPFLLIHGIADRITDPEGSAELYRRAQATDKTLSLFPNLYHETLNEPEKEQVLDEITEWMEEHT